MMAERRRSIILSPNFRSESIASTAKCSKKSLNFNSTDKRLSWEGSVKELESFLNDTINGGDENQLICSTNPKFTSFKSSSATIKFYPTTKTLQIQGKQGEELKTRLLEMISTKDNEIHNNFKDTSSLSDPTSDESNLKDLEKFINDSWLEVQGIREAQTQSNRAYFEDINKIWKTLELIYSTLREPVSKEPSTSTVNDTLYEALTSENQSLKQRLAEVESDLHKANNANFKLISTIENLSSNSSKILPVQPAINSSVFIADERKTCPSSTSQIEDYRNKQKEKYQLSSSASKFPTAPINSELLGGEICATNKTNQPTISQLEEYRKNQKDKYLQQQQQQPLLASSHDINFSAKQADDVNISLIEAIDQKVTTTSADDKSKKKNQIRTIF